MNINRNNYEEIFIDYHDGNLTAEQVADLFLFLEENPDLKQEFDSFSNLTLDTVDFEFPFKNELKKEEINETNFSQFMIASMEGDLSVDENRMLKDFLKINPARENDLKLFLATKLIPADEVYPGKNELKQPVPISFNFSGIIKYAVAAMLIISLIAGTYFMFIRTTVKPAVEMAQVPVAPPVEKAAPKQKDAVEINSQQATEQKSGSSASGNSMNSQQVQLAQKSKNENDINKTASGKNRIQDNDFEKIESLPVAEVGTINIKELPIVKQEQQIQSASPVAQVTPAVHPSQEKYMSVWEALRQASDRTLNKAVSNEDDALALADQSSSTRNSVKNILEKGIEKVSNDKVSINTQNDPGAEVSRFSFSLGNFKIEKDKAR